MNAQPQSLVRVQETRMIVYKITNTISGKLYIGITALTLEGRWAHHLIEASKSKHTRALYNAMKKYGIEAFRIEPICDAVDLAEARVLERRYIAGLGTMAPGGYNLTAGGDGVWGYKHTEEQCQRHAERHTGYRHTPAAIEKIRASSAGRVIPREAVERGRVKRLGQQRTLEQRALISKNRSGKGLGNQHRRLFAVEKIERALTLLADGAKQKEIAAVTGLSPSYVSNLATGKRGLPQRRVS